MDERISEVQTYGEGTNVHAGSLIFATTVTEAVYEERPLWLSVNIDGGALRQTLQIGDN